VRARWPAGRLRGARHRGACQGCRHAADGGAVGSRSRSSSYKPPALAGGS
jgi:hypothetical protein